MVIKPDKIGELHIFRCYTIVKVGLWFPRGGCGSCSYSVFLLGGISKRCFQRTFPMQSAVILLNWGDMIPEFGEVEKARIQKAEYQIREGFAEKSAWVSWKGLLDTKLLKYEVTLHKGRLKATKGCKVENSQSLYRTGRHSNTNQPYRRDLLKQMGHSIQKGKE